MIKHFLLYLAASFIMTSSWSQTETYVIKKTDFSTGEYAEFSPVYYRDGVVFCSNRDHGILNYSDSSDNYFLNMYYVDTAGLSEQKHPVLFSGNLSSRFNDGPASFDSTGETIYFTRNLILKGSLKKVSSRWNKLGIFTAELRNGEWTRIREFRLNTRKFNLFTPCLSPGGEFLFFASDMPDGYGGSDIYYCEWKNGYWGNPVNLGPTVNTAGNEAYPFLTSSGNLFFSSDGRPGYGKKDIFLTMKSDSGWSPPVLLDAPVNSKENDFGILSKDPMTGGYFSSDRDGTSDIYRFKTIYPQVFHKNYQREENYCYSFILKKHPEIDTTLVHFVWQFEDGQSSKGPQTKKCYPGPGKYNLYFDVVDNQSGDLFFREHEYLLDIKESGEPVIKSPSVALKQEEIRFRGTAKDFPGYRVIDFAWDFGDQTRKHGENVTHTYPKAGDYEVDLFLTLQSDETGETKKSWVTKKLKIMNSRDEKESFLNELADRPKQYLEPDESEDVKLIDSGSTGPEEQAVFVIELLTSPEKLDRTGIKLREVPDKYMIREKYDEKKKIYSYSIMQQTLLMELYPAFREVKAKGFSKAKAEKFVLTDPAEKALFKTLQNYSTYLDAIFVNEDQLGSNAYNLLDDLAKVMQDYPEVKLEVSVHTSNEGFPSTNLSRSQLQAKKLSDYLISRGVDKNRLRIWGYGGSKPIASNDTEEGRRINERVEFRIMK